MKNPLTTRTLGMLTLGALLSVSLLPASKAQDPEPSAERPGRAGPGIMRGALGGRDQMMRARGAERSPERFIELLDSDGDGQVSSAEYLDEQLQRVDVMFERRDQNEDGLLSLEETGPRERDERPRREGRRARPELDREAIAACVRETIADYQPDTGATLEERFDSNDTTNDGQLNLEEVSTALEARALEQFARIDADGNGFLTESDLSEHFAAQQNVREKLRDCVRTARG